jgi:hypothetical protein
VHQVGDRNKFMRLGVVKFATGIISDLIEEDDRE